MSTPRKTAAGTNLGLLISAARDEQGLLQGEVAERVTREAGVKVTQPQVSRHEAGDWSAEAIVELPAAYGKVLGIPQDQIQAAIGHPVVRPEDITFKGMILSDPDLDDESKHHLINQYGLLRAASAHNRAQSSQHRTGMPTAEEIENNTTLTRWMKDKLLADLEALDGEDPEPNTSAGDSANG